MIILEIEGFSEFIDALDAFGKAENSIAGYLSVYALLPEKYQPYYKRYKDPIDEIDNLFYRLTWCLAQWGNSFKSYDWELTCQLDELYNLLRYAENEFWYGDGHKGVQQKVRLFLAEYFGSVIKTPVSNYH